MPILWRHLIKQYTSVLLLCTLSFIAILLVMRLEEVAHFAALGASFKAVMLFVIYQVPYILPIAIPISSLLSTIILLQRMSQTSQLTAWRACGLAVRDIITPILIVAFILSIGSFYITSELATQSHLTAGLLKSELRAVNPLLLLNNKHFMRLKGFYFDVLGPSRLGESASDIVLAMPNKSSDRLNVMIAKNLQTNPLDFHGKGITIITSLGRGKQEDPTATQFDHLMVENIGSANTTIQDFAQMVQRNVWALNHDHLRMGLLLTRLEEEKKHLLELSQKENAQTEIKQVQRGVNRISSEIARRISLGLAVLTFTIMGIAFGINIGRTHTNRGLYIVIGLVAFYLISYFAGKAVEHLFIAAALLYLLPHLIIIALSLWALNRAVRGLE